MKHDTLGLALGIILPFVVGCSLKKEPQDGVVSFTLAGKSFVIKPMRFVIYPELRIGEASLQEQVRPRTNDNKMEFWVRPTKKFYDDGKKTPAIYLHWRTRTERPEDFVKNNGEISMTNSAVKLEDMSCEFSDSEFKAVERTTTGAAAPQECWIRVDEFAEDRVKGRFGVNWRIEPRHFGADAGSMTGQLGQVFAVIDGKFDLPYTKLYK